MGGMFSGLIQSSAPKARAQAATIVITTPATPKHAGLAVSAVAGLNGGIAFHISGRGMAGAVATDVVLQVRFGTGAPPVLDAAVTGTQVGLSTTLKELLTGLTADHNFGLKDLITGLTPGTTYWVDIAASCASGNATLNDVIVNLEPY